MSAIDDFMDTVSDQIDTANDLNPLIKFGLSIIFTLIGYYIVKYSIVRPWGRVVMSTDTAWDDKLHRPIANRAYFFLFVGAPQGGTWPTPPPHIWMARCVCARAMPRAKVALAFYRLEPTSQRLICSKEGHSYVVQRSAVRHERAHRRRFGLARPPGRGANGFADRRCPSALF